MLSMHSLGTPCLTRPHPKAEDSAAADAAEKQRIAEDLKLESLANIAATVPEEPADGAPGVIKMQVRAIHPMTHPMTHPFTGSRSLLRARPRSFCPVPCSHVAPVAAHPPLNGAPALAHARGWHHARAPTWETGCGGFSHTLRCLSFRSCIVALTHLRGG